MTETFDRILETQQLTFNLGMTSTPASIEAENDPEPAGSNGLQPGASVGHSDYLDFRGVYVGPGRRPGLALVRVTAGWLGGELPTWPVSIPYSKLVEV